MEKNKAKKEEKKFRFNKILLLPIALAVIFTMLFIVGDMNIATGEVFIFNKTIDLMPLSAVSYEDYRFTTESGYINVEVKNSYMKSYQTVLVGVYDKNSKEMITYDSTYILTPGESEKMTFKLNPGTYVIKETAITYSKKEVINGICGNGLMTYSGLINIIDERGMGVYEKIITKKFFGLMDMSVPEYSSVVKEYIEKFNTRTGGNAKNPSDIYRIDTNCEEAKVIKMYYVLQTHKDVQATEPGFTNPQEKLKGYGIDVTSTDYDSYDEMYNKYAIARQAELEAKYGANASLTFNVRAGYSDTIAQKYGLTSGASQQISLSRVDSNGNTIVTTYNSDFIDNYAAKSTAEKEQFTKDVYQNGSAQFIISNIYALQSASAGKELVYWEPPSDWSAEGFKTFEEALKGVTLTKKSAGTGAVEPLIAALVNTKLEPTTTLDPNKTKTTTTEVGTWYKCRTSYEKPISSEDIPNNTSTQELKNLNALKGKSLEELNVKLLSEINTHRTTIAKVGTLEYNKDMSINALAWAIFCRDYNLYDHEYLGTESISYTSKFKQWGYTAGASEIMYYGSEYPLSSEDMRKVIDGFVGSDSHKKALENKDFKYVGIGLYPVTAKYDSDGKYVSSVIMKDKAGTQKDEVKDGQVKYIYVVHLSKDKPTVKAQDTNTTKDDDGKDDDGKDDDDDDEGEGEGINLMWFGVLGVIIVVIGLVMYSTKNGR